MAGTDHLDHPDHPDRAVAAPDERPPDPTGGSGSTAWVSLVVLALAVVVGVWAATAILDRRGDGLLVVPESAALGLLAYLVLAGVVLPPAVLAVRNGQRARREGHRHVVVVVVLAGSVALVVLLGLPVVMSRIIGWPMVVALVAGVLAVGWLTQRWGWGHVGRSGPVGSG